jgi:glycosyltransferase involved in cell wall biosynthesis
MIGDDDQPLRPSRSVEATSDLQDQSPQKIISIITPYYNEEDSLVECVEAIRKLFREDLSAYTFEHIFCDNNSSDRSLEILKAFARHDQRVKIIVNSRNFGILKNTYNGVMSATGDGVVLFMPVDLQDPPELIPKFVKYWEQGYEVVYGIRAEREEGVVIKTARRLYYRLLSRMTYVDYPPDAGDFQFVDRKVLDAMKRIDDAQPFMRLMTFDVGFRSIGIKYNWRARKHGVSRNRFLHMVDQGLNGLVSFSSAPLRIALVVGFIISAASLLYALAVLVLTLAGQVKAGGGVPTIITALFFFGGVQLFFLGVIGEYIMAIFNQVRRKPMVVERERINFNG